MPLCIACQGLSEFRCSSHNNSDFCKDCFVIHLTDDICSIEMTPPDEEPEIMRMEGPDGCPKSRRRRLPCGQLVIVILSVLAFLAFSCMHYRHTSEIHQLHELLKTSSWAQKEAVYSELHFIRKQHEQCTKHLEKLRIHS
jgi:hypothetical protein